MSKLILYYKKEIEEIKREIICLNTSLSQKENRLNELNIQLRHKEGNSHSKRLKDIPVKKKTDKSVSHG